MYVKHLRGTSQLDSVGTACALAIGVARMRPTKGFNMTLTYWCAPCLDDSRCYNVRAKTKKECKRLVDSYDQAGSWGPVEKVTVTYTDAYDLMFQASGEGGLCEEPG